MNLSYVGAAHARKARPTGRRTSGSSGGAVGIIVLTQLIPVGGFESLCRHQFCSGSLMVKRLITSVIKRRWFDSPPERHYGGVAQWLEQVVLSHRDVGSNPTTSSNFRIEQ